jgi:protocatechuate 3,4-dioxygenase beta subunit
MKHLNHPILTLKRVSFSFMFLLLGLFVVNPSYAATFRLSGTVKDIIGNPIGGVVVNVKDVTTNTDVGNNTTTSDGNYTLDINQGTYNIQITPPTGSNLSSLVTLNYMLSSDTVLNFILAQSGFVVLNGHIYDSLGNPLANTTVKVTQTLTSQEVSTTTDTNGAYALQTTPGTYRLTVSGRSSTSGSSNVPQGYFIYTDNYPLTQSTALDITLPLKRVILHVQDPASSPVSNVEINISKNIFSVPFLESTGYAGTTYGSLTDPGAAGPLTDAAGNVTLWLWPSEASDITGQYIIVAVPPSGNTYQTTTLSNITITEDTNLTLTLQQLVTLSGHVYDSLGNPLSNTTVKLAQPLTGATTQTITDTAGAYSLQVVPMSYKLTVSGLSSTSGSSNLPQSYNIYTNNYSISQNTTRDITLPLKKVILHVQDPIGSPVGNVEINISKNIFNVPFLGSTGYAVTSYGPSAGAGTVGPLTDAAGNVTLWLWPSATPDNITGQYVIVAIPPSGNVYQTTTLSNVGITDDTNITMTLQQLVTLGGRVYDALGNPLANTSVKLTQTITGQSASTTTNTSGNYSLQMVPGTYQLMISGNGNTSNSPNLPQSYYIYTNYQLAQNANLNITLPLKKVILHVQDPIGSPVGNVKINISKSIFNVPFLGTSGYAGTTYGSLTDPGAAGPLTDASGNVTLWLWASNTPDNITGQYVIVATPSSGSIYQTTTLSNVGITSDQDLVLVFSFNHAQPVTTLTYTPERNTDGTYKNPTTITLTAVAAEGYTVTNIYYTLDGGSRQNYQEPFMISGDGNHTLTYWSTDNSGVPEAPNSKTFTILTTYTLDGAVYIDTNQNGFQDTDETGYSGATITLSTGQSIETDGNGSYSFTGLIGGTYTESLSVPSGYSATTTNPVDVAMSADTTQNFGIAMINVTPVVGTITAPITPVQINTSFSVQAQFSDANPADTHTALIDWGDSITTQATVTEQNGQGTGSAEHVYTQAGVYTITVTVTDNHNLSDSEHYQYITVYDPSAGWVTGSKEFTSPAGALVSDPNATGVASFGFTAKYVGGNLIPIGHKWASLDFKSGGSSVSFNATSYTSLVIMGSKSILRGTGEYNGAPGYSVLATAIDSGTGSVTDYVRYKIKDPSGNVVYDTQPGAVDTEDPTLPVTKGKIDVH